MMLRVCRCLAASVCLLAAALAAPRSTLVADYVVIGSGSTGSVLAGRLALGDPNATVLVLEAGGLSQSVVGGAPVLPDGSSDLSLFDIPLDWVDILTNASYSGEYEWEVPGAGGLNNSDGQQPGVSVAKAVGGCAVHNAMVYVRGTPFDFQPGSGWPKRGWEWGDVLEYYKRSENSTCHNSGSASDKHYHSSDGPVQISRPAFADVVGDAFEDAATRYTGVPRNEDFNGAVRAGAGRYDFLIRRDGKGREIRDAGIDAFWRVGSRPPNMRLASGVTATKILLDGGGGLEEGAGKATARGARVLLADGKTEADVIAMKEIIVSAGAIGTPKLLLLSGIGPAKELDEVNVTCRSNVSGVGKQFMDGVCTVMQWKTNASGQLPRHCSPFTLSDPYCAAQWSLYNSGSTGNNVSFGFPGLTRGAFLVSPFAPQAVEGADRHGRSSAGPAGKQPDIQVTIHPWDKLGRWPVGTLVATVELCYILPRSRGEVKLRSDKAADNVLFYGSYLSHPQDLAALSWGVDVVRDIMGTQPMAGMVEKELLPGAAVTSEEEKSDFIRCLRTDKRHKCDSSVLPNQHLTGTARLGDLETDETAVVGADFGVRGVDRLRVADASVLRLLPSGNSHASCMMIGERAAEEILKGRRVD
jgi:choline dehydrogenase-like flavoprotein